jgi:YgiT-type zinc finger domain-containing protein
LSDPGHSREQSHSDHDLSAGSEALDELAKKEKEAVMKSCPFCKAPVKRKMIEHVHRWGKQLFLFKNVQAEVCRQCGETFLKPAVLRLMDRCTTTGKVGRARVTIPVISLPDKVSA